MIPKSELDALKRDVSLVRLVEARGVLLRGQGDNLLGLCPFHDDKEPSLVVSPSKNVWHCLGACKTGGSVIDWVMKADKVSFRLAVEMLKKTPFSLAVRTPVTAPKLEPMLEPDEPDRVVLKRVVGFYHQTLKESAEGLAYLEARGLRHPEVVSHFTLGYSNRTLGYRLPNRNRHKGAAQRGQLERIGLYRESGHEHMAGSLTIPIFAEDGAEVLELYGRKIQRSLRAGTPKHLYLPARPDGRRGVFNRAGLGLSSGEVILCEALIDALTFWCAGFRNVTSAYGVSGFTPEMRAAFAAHGVKKVLIAYDRDEAGERAASTLAETLGQSGLEVFRVLFPKGMDANAYAQKVTPADKALEAAIHGATWMAGTRPASVFEALVVDEASVADEEVPHDPVTGEVLEAAPIAQSNLAASPASAPKTTTEEKTEVTTEEVTAEELRAQEVRFRFGDRSWRVRGLSKNTSYESLRVNLLVAKGPHFFVDTLELYSARHRAAYLAQAADELTVESRILKSDLGRIVLRLEDLVHAEMEAALAPKEAVVMSPEDHAAALSLLTDPDLFARILEAFEVCGVVGEETNKLISYLAAVSRKLESPLAVVFQSSSAAGKSSLMEAALRFVPPEDRVHYSAMTGQSLFYMGEQDLRHKVLAISEEEGAHTASYALKLLQSEGQLTIASTGKDPASGRLLTHEYKVEGPVAIFLTTTALEVDEELLNRCLVLTVDEGPGQTAAIHAQQRLFETLEGVLSKRRRARVVELHQNAQRLLEPLLVVNPHAEALRFSSQAIRTRRDHAKYLSLIRVVALLHQHQRPVCEVEDSGEVIRYIEVTAKDIELAHRLADKVLTPNLDDLPPQTRRLLQAIESYVKKEASRQGIEEEDLRFSRRALREETQMSPTQLRVHLGRLEELEYILVYAGGGKRRTLYGLASVSESKTSEADILTGPGPDLAGAWRADDGPGSAKTSVSDSAKKPSLGGAAPKALKAKSKTSSSYTKAQSSSARPKDRPERGVVRP